MGSMFDDIRHSLRDAMSRLSRREDRDALLLMRDGLVDARVALNGMRDALAQVRAQLVREREERATAERRGRLATDIGDAETARIASEFEQRHASRISVLERKLSAQEEELAMAESEIAEMTRAYRSAAAGVPGTPGVDLDEIAGLGTPRDANDLRRDIDRAAREAEAERRLAELKKRMGR